MGSGRALEVVCNDALYKSMYFIFLLLLNKQVILYCSLGASAKRRKLTRQSC